jgi:GTP-binding protein LepA
MTANIRNFSIIAHIDHGKSTLADRFLELTNTVEARKMKAQVLDSMELERERGITIKMQPVRMRYERGDGVFDLNLIDTPGHIDFSYEVSRALKAVEGVVLLVDATQGIQAQTLTTLRMAKEQGLAIIPALTKIDMPHARVKEVGAEVSALLSCDQNDIRLVSGKTGVGVPALLDAVCDRVPPPASGQVGGFRGLIFDFQYSNHRGVIVFIRVFDGAVKKGEALRFAASGQTFKALEVGFLRPAPTAAPALAAGEIGYIVTGSKEPGSANVGDTIVSERSSLPPLLGYAPALPVVWASVFPADQDDFAPLRQALNRLRLSDSSLSFEEESSGVLGRGFRCGFLGLLHLEIVTERLRREFSLEIVITAPSIAYEVTYPDGRVESVYSAVRFPEYGEKVAVREPWVKGKIIAPPERMGAILTLLHEHETAVGETEVFGDGRTLLAVEMPLRELMRNFFDKLKNVSSGYASFSYEMAELRPAPVARLDVLVAEELVPAFSRVVGARRAEYDARATVERLFAIMPRQQFATKIQAKLCGRIVASKTLSALKKDVTAHLYGGDITRKMKLRENQKRGKKKLLERNQGRLTIPPEVFMKMVKSE